MIIWYFADAPFELRALSTSGGDEDYLVYIPPNSFDLLEDWFGHMEDRDDDGEYEHFEEHNGTSFAPCSVDRFVLYTGARVYIGSQA